MKCTTIAQILAYTAPVFSVPMPQLGGLLGSLPTISLPTSLPTSIPGLGSGTGTTTALPTSIAGLGSSTTGTSTSSGLTGLSGLTSAAGSSTENDVTSNTGCKALTVIFARGTSETGNMGTIIGPPLVTSLQTAVGTDQVAAQGVDYDASIAGNAQLGADGGPTMAALVKQALSQCPSTKVVLSGYSQGAMVVHNAAGSLTSGQFVGVALFGDPLLNSAAVANIDASKVKEFCASGDAVCETGTFTITAAHLSYGSDADAAAAFLKTAAGL